MPDFNEHRRAREDVAPQYGRRLLIQCDRPGCGHAVIMDPRPLFGAGHQWPLEGRSERFRCQCGHREAMVSYTRNASQANGPISADAIRLWC